MATEDFLHKAKTHWETWRPRETRRLKARKAFQSEMYAIARRAQAELVDLVNQGYPPWAAEEVALKTHVLVDPEPADEDDWEARELAEKERAYQEMMREPPPAQD